MSQNCLICSTPTVPEKRIIVTTPEGKKEFYCNGGCADARIHALTPDKQKHSYER